MSEPQIGKSSEEETDGLSEPSTCMAKTLRNQARVCSQSSSEIDDLPEERAEEEQGRSISSRNINNVKRSKSAKTAKNIKKESNPKPKTKSARKERRSDSTGRKQSLLDDPETNPMSSLDISPGIEWAAENTVQNIFKEVGLSVLRNIIMSLPSRLTKL